MSEKRLREHLTNLLSGRGAHVDWKAAFDGIPPKLRGVRPSGMPRSLWELLEHMRIAQWDILEFSRDPKHASPDWPAGYWPESPEPPDAKAWEKSLKLFARDLAASPEFRTARDKPFFAKLFSSPITMRITSARLFLFAGFSARGSQTRILIPASLKFLDTTR